MQADGTARVAGGADSRVEFEGRTLHLRNVVGGVEPSDAASPATGEAGARVLRLERDLAALPFDPDDLAHTVDLPTYAVVDGLDLTDGVIEVEVNSQLHDPLINPAARGFIGVAFHVAPDDSSFEGIYLRPTNSRCDDQVRRNRTVQYFAHPGHRFDRLRRDAPGQYETWADIALGEWTPMRVEFQGRRADLFLHGQHTATLVVPERLGPLDHGGIGLWVDIDTVGRFRRLRITG